MRNPLLSRMVLLAVYAVIIQAVGTNDQVNSGIDFGTFQNPSANVRPRFRYWANDASHSLSRIADDVRSIAQAGAGGLELLGYYLYGQTGENGGESDAVVQTDWTVYGFGQTPWKNLQDTVLSTAKDESLSVDLAIGPNQGAGVPAEYNDDGLLWDLAGFNVTITNGTNYSAVLPGWGGDHNLNTLVAATTALVVNQSQDATQITLSATSLTDHTSHVDTNGTLSIVFNNTNSSSAYVLFVFYLQHSRYREVVASSDTITAVPQSPIETWNQNGSWVVDHFSSAGAQIVINFWEDYLLTGNSSDAILQAGNYMWEDSQEYYSRSNVLWTPALPQTFESNRGYSFNNYIPLITGQNYAGGGAAPSFPVTYMLDEADGGSGHIQDFQQTLTELNAIYLTNLTSWSNSLGIQFSAQVGYNLPIDMLAAIPLVNGPECETLGFNHNIDTYRQFAGPANLAGKRVISSETGVFKSQAYQEPVPELLWDIKRAVAGGVNQFVLHGYPFSGNYGNTTWPGFTTFAYVYSEMHGPRQPGWEFYREWLDWTARTQFVMQTGVPKVDLAFWLKATDAYLYGFQFEDKYSPLDLKNAGYTYEYLSPDNFGLPEAYVRDGIFAPDRQAFRALIIRANDSLTLPGVQKLAEYADAGLPIILSGGIPSTVFGYNQAGNDNLTARIEGLTQLRNVHVVPYENLASSLASLNILPRTAITANGSWFTYWRDDNATFTQFVYVYNDAVGLPPGQGISVANISFETTGKPFLYDAWNGEVTSLSSYQQSETHTTMQLELAGNQSIIIGFQSDSNSKNLENSLRQSSFQIANTVTTIASESCTLSNWTLTVESWGPANSIYDIEVEPTKTNTSYVLNTLMPWSLISDSIRNVSGRGYYRTAFIWPLANTSIALGAFIDLGTIVHTARLSVNGQIVPPLDPTWARADIGPYLVHGTNVVDVLVSTPLGNGLRSMWDLLDSSGKLASFNGRPPPNVADYGLVEDVKLMAYT
ncbi:unnamed protein product [Discula destructiva]